MSWYEQNPKLLENTRINIKQNYPGLRLEVDQSIAYIKGALSLKSETGKEIELFQVEIELPANYPIDIPITREIGGRFPKVDNRHFNLNGSACLFFDDERYKYYPSGSDVFFYIENCVKPFLFWQLDFEIKNGKNPLPARGHGEHGIIEFYKEELLTEDPKCVLKGMEYLTAKKIRRHWQCYCGGDKKVGECHLEHLTTLKKRIPRKLVKASYTKLKQYL